MSLWATRDLAGPYGGITAESLIPSRSAGTGTSVAAVTNDTALRHSAVWACLRVRADLISTMPIDVYRRMDGFQVEVNKPPILVTPGGNRVGIVEWMYSTQFDLDRAGNAFGLITERNAMGLPSRIDLQSLGECSVRRTKGVLSYRIGNKSYTPEQVWHERQFTVAGLDVGLAPVAYAAWAIAEYLSLEKFALDWFGGGAIPSVHLKNTAKTLIDTDADAVKSRYRATVSNGDAFVSGADWELTPIQAFEHGSAWIEAQKYGVADIARFFGVPGDLIDAAVASRSITYANITQRMLQFLIVNLGPAVVRREGALSTLLPQSRYVKLNTNATILRLDPQTRADMLAVQLESRQIAPSEAREIENRPPYTAAQLQEFTDLYGPPGSAAPTPPKPKSAPGGGNPDGGTQ